MLALKAISPFAGMMDRCLYLIKLRIHDRDCIKDSWMLILSLSVLTQLKYLIDEQLIKERNSAQNTNIYLMREKRELFILIFGVFNWIIQLDRRMKSQYTHRRN